MKELFDKKYQPQIVEKDKYEFWKANGYFTSDVNSPKPPFAIVIPPPNVTGKLHLGHAWDTTLQDLIIRYKKLNGYDTLYLPGMDHAGIATQSKVEERLRTVNNILRHDLGREKFIEQVWAWKEEYADIIRSQWAKLGLALDYQKEQFTLNDNLSLAVRKVFRELYNKGLIYRGYRIIPWDPHQQTALSNIEVIYKEAEGKMYYFKYFLENSTTEYLTIATTRPETMFADQCVIVNPQDERYKKYWNKKVINPANNELIPVICDDYVEMDFGTGAMKCTPAHDPNDYEIGLRHHLAMPICMNLDGTMNELAGKYQGQDRFAARSNLVTDLIAQGLVVKIENHHHQVGFSERSDTIVEPYLSKQWFVKMQPLARAVINLQNSAERVNFFPERFNRTLLTWMENIQDWCISRQLWWGHQIPVWYHKNDETKIYVGVNPPSDLENWTQDEDVLDTWFSSALWPFTTLGWNWDEKLFNRYFPTNVLVTGYDIIFFWVSRMMFQALEFTEQKPFNDVLIHGLIRDEQGRKMSKSLGNGIDPMDVIDQYGADTLRHFLMTNSAPGQDLRYSQEKINASWNFINKLWNASRYVLLNLPTGFVPWTAFANEIDQIIHQHQENNIDSWILSELTKTLHQVKENMDNYEFVLAGKELYDFVWNKYCSWYIELAKVNLNSSQQEVKEITLQTLYYVLKQILIMLHPFIPFVSEEIYQHLNLQPSIMLETYPDVNFTYPVNFLNDVIMIIPAIRELRNEHNIGRDHEIKIIINPQADYYEHLKTYQPAINEYLKKLVNAEIIEVTYQLPGGDYISLPLTHYTLEVITAGLIDRTVEQEKLKQELAKLEQELERSRNILNNQNFLTKASPEKVKAEQEKYQQYLNQYEQIKGKL
ncbi:valine--tRNA ligase [Spiroplasma eriocheiris]|uniref:Valine--tRNA ligase n=1 Tax=Spiroplasma eriocheiris TaxID=315358 RepID=A0A0H3XHA6_9MOLU|nr:valine--tRNA ligase [Spiroplasma eriocheiris]AHF57571.1 valyl-tRNA synthetase [Spiroplasma eriocheiris CCTCC M 207170]AKM54028.1 valyl-tRNA synthetase [Spiroplasma eriocheiris]